MEIYFPFPCNCCGECCRHIDKIIELENLDSGNGVCKFLNKDNRCSIYQFRPAVCRGEYIYHKYYSNLSVKDFHKLMCKYCNFISDMSETKSCK